MARAEMAAKWLGPAAGSTQRQSPLGHEHMPAAATFRTYKDPLSEPNPFKLPEQTDALFRMRDEAVAAEKTEKSLLKTMSLHDRARMSQRPPIHLLVGSSESAEEEAQVLLDNSVRDEMADALDRLAVSTRDRRVEQQQLSEFVNSKRELFLLKFSLDIKKEEMIKLEEKAAEEERRLTAAEKQLEADATRFDQFLRENDRSAVEAIKLAEDATRSKHSKLTEIKRLQAEVMAVNSEVTKQDDGLAKLRRYRDFLFALAPPEWQRQQIEEQQEAFAARVRQLTATMTSHDTVASLNDEPASTAVSRRASLRRRPSRAELARRASGGMAAQPRRSMSRNAATSQAGEANGDSGLPTQSGSGRGSGSGDRSPTEGNSEAKGPQWDEVEKAALDELEMEVEPPLYFTGAAQLLEMLEKLEESNLSLIQNGQEAEELLQDLKDRLEEERQSLLQDRSVMEEQISNLEKEIKLREKMAQTLKERCQYFMAAAAGDQESELSNFDAKVAEVYRACIGENEAGIDTLQMLTNIENRLEELFEKMQKMPAERLVEAEKEKDKQRRRRLREEKLEAQRRHQEERVRRAQERAQAQPKRQHGKKLMFRSAPPEKKKTEARKKEQTAEEEERRYFFS